MTRTLRDTPAQDGFFMPAEWAQHSGSWMIWPERPDNWRLGAKPAQAAFAAVAEAIAETEPVTMCASTAQFQNARRQLSPRIRVVEMTSNDSWARDCGPTFVVDGAGRVRGVDWRFNAWGGLDGGLYFPWDQDELVAPKILDIERIERYAAPLVLEGGSVHVDGEGTLLTTGECLLNKNRNPNLTKDEIEAHLKDYLGVTSIIWLDRGVHNDETDGHIDNLACFAKPGVVLLTWTDDRADPQYEISQDAFERLSRARDAKGRSLEIVKLHQPGPLYMTADEAAGVDVVEGSEPRVAGTRLAGSYVNFYICNDAVIAPLLDPARDAQAIETLSRVLSDRHVKGVDAREILLGGGNIHCILQQQPSGR
jgi:agmatine deiminase